ncbi:MAG: PIN domain-containing protein [candidate division NC10 bacterium]|nr:PIN domain-containing protein [candidate division NC10 bacterium]
MAAPALLIDSSVWIDYYRPRGPKALQDRVREALTRDVVVTTGIIVVEVLQGARTEEAYIALRDDFSGLRWLEPSREAIETAARLGFELQQRGTPVPATDLVIASVAMEHGCRIWHRDAHFTRVAGRTSLLADHL